MADVEQLRSVVASLYTAMLDATAWPETARLINEVCGSECNSLLVGEGPSEDRLVQFVGVYGSGQRLREVEREYLEFYYPIDERVPRIRRLSDGRVVCNTELYSDCELKTSPTYNEFHGRVGGQHGLVVRLEGLDGSGITWALGDSVSTSGWESAQVDMVKRLSPHIRQLIKVRQALQRVGAAGRSLKKLLEGSRTGVMLLDRRRRIVDANRLAREILQFGDGLVSQSGVLTASTRASRLRLDRLLNDALEKKASVAVGGSMMLGVSSQSQPSIVLVRPVRTAEGDLGGEKVRAMVLIVEPGRRLGISPEAVAMALGLTPAQSRVGVLLAEGRTVREIARATGRKEASIYSLVKQIYGRLGISRQVDLVRLVYGLSDAILLASGWKQDMRRRRSARVPPTLS